MIQRTKIEITIAQDVNMDEFSILLAEIHSFLVQDERRSLIKDIEVNINKTEVELNCQMN